jgi:hypothetical protein
MFKIVLSRVNKIKQASQAPLCVPLHEVERAPRHQLPAKVGVPPLGRVVTRGR